VGFGFPDGFGGGGPFGDAHKEPQIRDFDDGAGGADFDEGGFGKHKPHLFTSDPYHEPRRPHHSPPPPPSYHSSPPAYHEPEPVYGYEPEPYQPAYEPAYKPEPVYKPAYEPKPYKPVGPVLLEKRPHEVSEIRSPPVTVHESYTNFDCRRAPYPDRHYADPEAGCAV